MYMPVYAKTLTNLLLKLSLLFGRKNLVPAGIGGKKYVRREGLQSVLIVAVANVVVFKSSSSH